jgi:selenocysteine-specific translation elongation factor
VRSRAYALHQSHLESSNVKTDLPAKYFNFDSVIIVLSNLTGHLKFVSTKAKALEMTSIALLYNDMHNAVCIETYYIILTGDKPDI